MYRILFKLFLTKVPPKVAIEQYINLNGADEDNFLDLQDWCSEYTKLPFLTGIGIIDAIDILYKNRISEGDLIEDRNV